MASEPVVIPEKIYFKIGEVCDLLGVQAHVLRYWETEFSVLSPQKNKSGQRSYRRRDVEIALRIKQLLYNEMFTIAGARKKLQSDARDGSRAKAVEAASVPRSTPASAVHAPTLFDTSIEEPESIDSSAMTAVAAGSSSAAERDVLKAVAGHLLELREMLSRARI